jgi:hypothetical protein
MIFVELWQGDRLVTRIEIARRIEAGGELISLDDCLRIARTNKQPRAFN